ncbi:MAG: RHS repeat-associated core domain-containing protein [Pseudomonadota bacterium]
MTLHYASNWAKGYKTMIRVPASGSSVPASLKRIDVQVEIAGRTFKQTLEPLPNSRAEFIWDGLDYRGKPVYGETVALTSVGYVYVPVYYTYPDWFNQRMFAIAGEESTNVLARQLITMWTRNYSSVHGKPGKNVIAEGFTLSSHRSEGSTEKSVGSISTVAGIGVDGWDDNCPIEVKVDAAGDLYILENWGGPIVRKVHANGVATIAGTGAPAGADWISADGLDVDRAGNLYIADHTNGMVLKLDENGIVTRIAGNGTTGFSGDGGPAVNASLYEPWDVAVDSVGNAYIADLYRIRKVDTSGMITTIAGNGIECWGCCSDEGMLTWDCTENGALATETPIFVQDVTADAEGNLYYTDYLNHCIRKVSTSGIISTVAGKGIPGYSGDGGLATDASLYFPTSVSTDPLGNLYIADYGNNRIRKVYASGSIVTIAGNGLDGYNGDGGAATSSSLSGPTSAVVDAAGSLYIADCWNERVRMVASTPLLANADEIAFPQEDGSCYVMSFDGLHKRTVDLSTGVVLRRFGYDGTGNLLSTTDQFGNVTNINRNGSGVPVSITSPYGLTTWLTINADNQLTKISYPDGSFYSFEYTSGGSMTAKVEPKGNRFERFYDSMGRVTDAFDSEAGHWSFMRTDPETGGILYQMITGEGNATSYLDHTDTTGAYTSLITDASSGTTSVSVSADGLTLTKFLSCGMEMIFDYGRNPKYGFKYVRKQSESTPSGLTKTIEKGRTYQDTDSNGIPDLITETITVNGKTTSSTNNVLQSEETVTSATGRTVTSFYDPDTLVTNSIAVSGLYNINYGYDSRGRLTSVISNTRQTTLTYDTKGNLQSVTDPDMRTTTYEYDPAGRVTLVRRPDTSTIGFSYDSNGNMTVLSNPVPVNHIFDHNGVNLLQSYETPLSGGYTYVYDKDKRHVQTIFPSGKQINNTYQDLRLTQIQTPEGSVYLDYLCSTKVGAMRKGGEEIEYGYDGKLVTSETFSGALNQSLGYTYNNSFDIIGFSYASGAVNYNYDNDGLLTGAGSFAITRNTANGLPEAVNGGALNLTRSFNGYGETEGEVYKVNNRVVNSWNVTRDNAGRITSKTETIDGVTSNYVYTYDELGRLLTVTKDGTLIEEYRYDPVGTRTYEMNTLRGIPGRSFDYSDEDHLLTAGNTDYGYDEDGFLTIKDKEDGSKITEFTYSSQGELLKVSLPENGVVEYVNDPLGRRIAKIVNGATVEKYLWQGLTQLLAIYDGNDNLLMRFEYADARMPVAMTKGGVKYYLSYDQIGSLRVVANVSGTVVKRIDYDSFGNISHDTNPSFEIPFGFAGGLHDRDTGLVRFGHRDYDPDVSRWTAKDPIFFAGGDTDLYGYCLNNPINLIDPNGLIAGIDDLAAIAALTALEAATAAYLQSPEGQRMLKDISGDVTDIIDKIKEEYKNKLQETKCETRTESTPPNFEKKPPDDPDLRRKLILAKILELVVKWWGGGR